MAVRIVVPSIGQTTDEVRLNAWRVQLGDAVKVGDMLADLETDKAVMELESIAAGVVLRLEANVGDMVREGDLLLHIGGPGEKIGEPVIEGRLTSSKDADTALSVPSSLPGEMNTIPPPALPTDRPLATPAARVFARKHAIDLRSVCGTGPRGCIVLRNVREAV